MTCPEIARVASGGALIKILGEKAGDKLNTKSREIKLVSAAWPSGWLHCRKMSAVSQKHPSAKM